jgi:hypothetical protein
LAGGEGGGGRPRKRAVKQFVVEQLAGDLGEAVGGKNGNGEGEAIVGVVVRLGDGWGEALAQFFKGGEAENTKMASGVVVEEEDFSHGGVCGGGLIAAAAGDFLQNLLYIGAGHIGFGQPVEGEKKISLHPAWSTKFCADKRIGEFAKIFHSGLRLFENVHAGGGGHRIEHEFIVPRYGPSPKETIFILIIGIDRQDEGRGRVSRMQKGAKDEKQEKDVMHKEMLRPNNREESEDAG